MVIFPDIIIKNWLAIQNGTASPKIMKAYHDFIDPIKKQEKKNNSHIF